MGFDVIEVDGLRYIQIDEYISHLNDSVSMVMAVAGDVNPSGANYVCDTLKTSIGTLKNARAQLDH